MDPKLWVDLVTQIKPQNFSFSLFTLLLVGCQLELNNPSKLVATASPLPDAVQVPFSQSFNFTDFTTSTLSDTTLFQTLDLSAALSTISQSDLGSASPGFSLGTFSGTFWDIPATFLRMDYTGTNRAFPNGSSATSGWQNMTSNVLLLHFEDAGGAVTFSDSSSSGLSLSCVAGCPTTSALGQVSNAESFPGGTMLRVPVAATFNSQTSFSISTWVKTAGAADQTIFSSYDGVHGYRVYLNPAGSLRSFNDATGVIDSQTTLNDGAWHHVVSIWGGGVNVLYVDGSARIAPPASFTPTSQENQIAGSCTGPNSTVCAQTLTGSLDEFAFFDRSLTPSEVSDIYERQSAVQDRKSVV